MLHLLPCLPTFNIVEYINGGELNKSCGVPSICNSLHIELHLTCSIVCCTIPCHASLNRTCIIFGCASCHVMLVCLPCCLLLSGLLLSLASVSFRSCEDSFVYVRLSSSWTRSSSYRDCWQDDYYPRYHFYLCFLVASFYRYAALPITCLPCPPFCDVSL